MRATLLLLRYLFIAAVWGSVGIIAAWFLYSIVS